jgi:hypothetical protein
MPLAQAYRDPLRVPYHRKISSLALDGYHFYHAHFLVRRRAPRRGLIAAGTRQKLARG